MNLRPLKVMTVFGTRPEAIKMAPVVLALRARPADFEVRVTVTAQHREMLDQVLRHFGLAPDHDLNVMTPRQTLTTMTVAMLEGLEKVLATDRPDIVLTHGDATTTFAASLAAFYAKVDVGHVEAGLRTHHKYSPWPEEMNRRLTGVIADVHFPPTPWARGNLIREGVPEERVYVTGNTAIDALLWTVRPDYRFTDPTLAAEFNAPETAGAADGTDAPGAPAPPADAPPAAAATTNPAPAGGPIIMVECHRRENWGQPMVNIYRALRRVLAEAPEVRLLVSAHLNPEAGEVARRELAGQPRVTLFPPVPYPDWVNLMARCYLIFTDSGGQQEEAPALGRPLVLARDTTERPEAVEAGTARVVGTDEDAIAGAILELVRDPRAYARMAQARNPFGDGRAAERIAQALLHFYGRAATRPDEWRPGDTKSGGQGRSADPGGFDEIRNQG